MKMLPALLALMLAAPAFGGPAAPGFPPEVMTPEAFFDEFRSPISMKLRDMRRSFRVREIRPGEIEFLDDLGKRVLSVSLERTLLEGGSLRLEETTIRNAKGQLLFKESVQTEGASLQLSPPARRILFEGRADYALTSSDETRKVVRISSDDKEIFKFTSSRARDGKSVFSDVHIAGSLVLMVRDLYEESGLGRSIVYEQVNGRYSLKTFGIHMNSNCRATFSLRAFAGKIPGHLLESHRFSMSGEELYGLESYLEKFNERVYSPFVVQGGARTLGYLTQYYFPETIRKASVGRNNRFLDELVNLRNQIEQAKTTPSLLSTVSTTVSSFITAITEGTLVVDDKRPQ